MFKVFVYGTLKPGEINYQRYCEGRIAKEEEAIASGANCLVTPCPLCHLNLDSRQPEVARAIASLRSQ